MNSSLGAAALAAMERLSDAKAALQDAQEALAVAQKSGGPLLAAAERRYDAARAEFHDALTDWEAYEVDADEEEMEP